MPKLTWKVLRDDDGNFVRRRIPGDRFSLEHIDVVWTHADGFPAGHVIDMVPVAKAGPLEYTQVLRELPAPAQLFDQVSVPSGTPDSTVAMLLDEKRKTIAVFLNIEP